MDRLGTGLWAAFAAAFLALELIAWIDGREGLPTASVLVKRWKNNRKWFRMFTTAVLFLAGPVLYLHWIEELF